MTRTDRETRRTYAKGTCVCGEGKRERMERERERGRDGGEGGGEWKGGRDIANDSDCQLTRSSP